MSITVPSLLGCQCNPKTRKGWYVAVYRANHSAFNGYRRTPSNYSLVRCVDCERSWRTKAAYVNALPSAPPHGYFKESAT